MGNKNTKLIIIGNGFDLYAGLKSSFSNFIQNRYYELDRSIVDLSSMINLSNPKFIFKYIYNNQLLIPKEFIDFDRLFESINDKVGFEELSSFEKFTLDTFDKDLNSVKRFNFWAAYFLSVKYFPKQSINNWIDVENLIADFIIGDNSVQSSSSKQKWKNFSRILSRYLNIENYSSSFDTELKKVDSNYNNIEMYSCLILLMLNENSNIFKYCQSIARNITEPKFVDLEEKVLEFLNSQLIEFEHEFNNYMVKISNNKNYKYNSFNIIESLSGKNNPNTDLLLNFNYTSPCYPKNIVVNNIHGKLISPDKFYKSRNNLIIGIDSSNVKLSSPEYQFTKLFKLIQSNDRDLTNVFDPNISVDEIDFFGHSLGLADYSYFKTIFDNVKLYNPEQCHVKIIFYYANHDNIPEYSLTSDQMINIKKLMNKYALENEHIENPDDFIRKLFFSNKIKIKNIDN